MGSGAKSYMRKGLLYMRKCANFSAYMTMPLVIYIGGQRYSKMYRLKRYRSTIFEKKID